MLKGFVPHQYVHKMHGNQSPLNEYAINNAATLAVYAMLARTLRVSAIKRP